ncbi:hypothetical protein Cni_G13785 [Canna indica]|uniref:Uncharacterized protein n=1 Tax=Canna indica TaxID=4628 RepID=A0AAQ3KAH9_9LILI|nr:hypothetical protein Cni_G13785 [Canna indica]
MAKCGKAPAEVRKLFKELLANNGSGGTSSVGSTSAVGAMNQSGSISSGPQIGRSSGISTFSNLEQRRSRIPANTADNSYYRTMVSTIQKVGSGYHLNCPRKVAIIVILLEFLVETRWIQSQRANKTRIAKLLRGTWAFLNSSQRTRSQARRRSEYDSSSSQSQPNGKKATHLCHQRGKAKENDQWWIFWMQLKPPSIAVVAHKMEEMMMMMELVEKTSLYHQHQHLLIFGRMNSTSNTARKILIMVVGGEEQQKYMRRESNITINQNQEGDQQP